MNLLKSSSIISFLVILVAIGLFTRKIDQSTIQSQFFKWKIKYQVGSEYSVLENIYRLKIFQQNIKKIQSHNVMLGRTYEMGLNQFSAMTQEEFSQQYLSVYQQNSHFVEVESIPTGLTVDWVSKGAVTSVKNQGKCNANYAFAVVGSIQGVSILQLKRKQEYSAQQIIDCSRFYGNSGCYGGYIYDSLQYLREAGINTETAYPYTGKDQLCVVKNKDLQIKGIFSILSCYNLAESLVDRPITVAVDGSNMQTYQSGVFSSCSTILNLALLLVGMTDNYWTLKNSWGVTWGQNGYIRIGRGNTCGICKAAYYPVL